MVVRFCALSEIVDLITLRHLFTFGPGKFRKFYLEFFPKKLLAQKLSNVQPYTSITLTKLKNIHD